MSLASVNNAASVFLTLTENQRRVIFLTVLTFIVMC
jgi:hypothetical protein